MVDTCNVVGNLLDSGISPIGATLEVKANSILIDDTTTPDSVILPAPRTFTIASDGVIDIDLPPTEPSKSSYTFKLSATGYFKEWEVSIPDQLSVEFASLLPTAFTQDRAVTGALRIVKELLTNPVAIPYIIEGLGLIRQATAPGTPDSNSFIWFNTTTGLWYTWDSVASKWLSEAVPVTVGYITALDSTTLFAPIPAMVGALNAKVTHAIVRYNVQSSPNDVSNYWSIQPSYRTASTTTPVNIGSAITTTQVGYTTGTVKEISATPNTALTLSAAEFMRVGVTKVGSPGNLNVGVTYLIRYYAG